MIVYERFLCLVFEIENIIFSIAFYAFNYSKWAHVSYHVTCISIELWELVHNSLNLFKKYCDFEN